jgi:hypothetical protein
MEFYEESQQLSGTIQVARMGTSYTRRQEE